MKRIYAPIFALCMAGAANAQSADVKKACDAINMLAPLVMDQRQSGTPMADLMPYANMAQGPVKAVVQNMIRDAYTVPRASGAAARRASNDFQKRWVRDCYASFN